MKSREKENSNERFHRVTQFVFDIIFFVQLQTFFLHRFQMFVIEQKTKELGETTNFTDLHLVCSTLTKYIRFAWTESTNPRNNFRPTVSN